MAFPTRNDSVTDSVPGRRNEDSLQIVEDDEDDEAGRDHDRPRDHDEHDEAGERQEYLGVDHKSAELSRLD